METTQKVTANDLFMLVYNLSQMTDNKKVVEVFSQALQELFPAYDIAYLKPGAAHNSNVLTISTANGDYGHIALGSNHPSAEDQALLQNICTMLALILGKNEQSRLLKNEKLLLTSLVEERTLHLIEQIEAQKKIAATLNESVEKFRVLYETMTQGVVYQSSNGYITSANPAAEKILGLSLDQMQGRTSMNPEWRALRENGDDLPGPEHPAMIALKTKKPVLGFVQGIFNPRINAHVWMRVDSIPQFKENSEVPDQVISIFSDITAQLISDKATQKANFEAKVSLEEAIAARKTLLGVVEDQKRTEATLRETKAYLENLLDYANTPIIVWDSNYRIQIFNKAFENLTGIAVKDAINQKLDFLFPEDSREETLKYIHSTAGKRWETIEIEILNRYGMKRTLLWNTAIIFATDGKTVSATIAQGQDITDRNFAEAESVSLTKKLNDLVNAVKSLSSAHTLEDIQEIAAKSARILTACDGATLVLREGDLCYYAGEDAISPLWKGQKFPMTHCISGWVMMNKKVAIIPDIYSDNRIPIDTYKTTFVKSLAMIPVNIDAPIAAIGNYWNTSYTPSELDIQLLQTLADAAAKAIENVLLLRSLESRVLTRTSELESAVKELESFSYSVSHDLRAPLRAIDGYVRILMEELGTTLDDESKRLCTVISDSAKNMGKLIDNLLAFSRIGKTSMQLSLVDMKPIIENVFDELTAAIGNVSIDFQVGALPYIMGDTALLKQAWSNLIGNAIKFSSKKDRPQIRINGLQRDNEVLFSIEDNGAGFDMKYADKLFGVFQRLHSQREFDGTGVGLAIVQRIINRHGGKIWAEAEIDKGATFYFTLKSGTHSKS